MQTQRLPCDGQGIAIAAQILRQGGLVAFPTETVYGLGANALAAEAVAAIFAAKGRPADNPLITHVSCIAQAIDLAARTPDVAKELMRLFWPGPLTLVLPRSVKIPDIVAAGLTTFAVRMPAHEGALSLIEQAGVPIAAPSANRSGRPSPTTAEHTFEDMQGRIPLILDGGPCRVGLESTVLDVSGDVPMLLRPGGVTVEQLECALSKRIEVARGVDMPLEQGERAASPGLLHRHYAPRAAMRIVHGAAAAYDRELASGGKPVILAQRAVEGRESIALGEDMDAVARALFASLRRADERGATLILFEALPKDGVGRAIMNRALRAAGFEEE